MIIKKIELQGFKSFPDRTKIIFHPGITAVVGPNGTGKSNIVDGILWVLGGQRHKGLRGEKTEDIIFNGNAKKPPLGMADVTLSLEHEEEEIAINHRVFRSGEGEYRLNGKAARLKDIQDALWKRAVGEKDYFVIEQGSIGLLITSKPAEKRLLLEEAAGTAYYKDKKKEAQSKLASSEQNLTRLEDIISEVAREKNSLQRQAQAAVRYRKLREKIRELTGLNYKRKLLQLEIKHGEASERHSALMGQEKEMIARIKEEERELAANRNHLWQLEKSIKDNQESLFSLQAQMNRLEAEREKESRRGELLEEKQRKATSAAEEFEQDLLSFERESSQRKKTLEELEEAFREKKKEMEEAESGFHSTRESYALLLQNIDTLKQEHLNLLSRLTECHNERTRAEKELELISRQELKITAQFEEEKTYLLQKEESLREVGQELALLEREKEEKKNTLSQIKAKIEETSAALETLKGQAGEISKRRDEESYKLQALKKLEENQRRLAASAEIPEALGLFADLIETDPEYTRLLDSLWKEEAASAVIDARDFLKKASEREMEGRFLLLRQDGKAIFPSSSIPASEVVGFLKSHLRGHPKINDYWPSFRDAAIVRDVKTAVELWLRFPDFDFVTLKGDVLLSSGLLKSGRREEGIFSLEQEIKSLAEEIARKEAEISPFVSAMETKAVEKRELEDTLAREISRHDDIGQRIIEKEKEKIAREAERERMASAVSLLSKELDILREEKASLSLQKDDLDRQTKSLEEEEKSHQSRIVAQEQEFATRQGKSIQDEKQSIEFQAALDLLEERASHIRQQLKELEKSREGARSKIDSFREEIRSSEKEETLRLETLKNIEAKVRTLSQEEKTKRAALREKETELESTRTQEEEREKKLKTMREESDIKKEERMKWEIIRAEIDRDLVNLEETCWQELKKTLHEVKNELAKVELSDADIEEQLGKAEEDLQKYKAVNLMAEEEYLSHKERHDFLIQQKEDLRKSIDDTQEAIRKIDEESRSQFLAALAEVNTSFQEVFTLLFKGGSAEVKLTDPENPLESGVEIVAQPPGKKVQNITLLSGGEKSLTSLAFLFALFRYKPTPFCILDEVDAALDDANLSRFLDLMKNIKKDTQFIIITHNYKTMEVADYIYGTTMAEPNITQIYSVKLEKQQELLNSR